MTNFAAIDFETANNFPSSVCSVGIVVVRNGIITDRIYRLIRPELEWYDYCGTHKFIPLLHIADTTCKIIIMPLLTQRHVRLLR